MLLPLDGMAQQRRALSSLVTLPLARVVQRRVLSSRMPTVLSFVPPPPLAMVAQLRSAPPLFCTTADAQGGATALRALLPWRSLTPLTSGSSTRHQT